MDAIHVWTDGSCINNGKDNASSAIGVFYPFDTSSNMASKLPVEKHTNNRAELCAILYVLCTNYAYKDIVIHTDSEYAIKCLTEYKDIWISNGWKTTSGKAVEWCGIIQYICNLIQRRMQRGGKTTLVHVRAHATDENNIQADLLARSAATNNIIHNKLLFITNVCRVPLE